LDSLPETYRDVLTLRYLGGMKSEEIARFLGTSPSNVRQRLSRARSKLKKEMLDMMSTTYAQQKLQPSFTFRIVEMVKHIKIQPAPRSTPWLPFSLSAATGIVLTVLMFSSHLISLTPLGALLGSPLPSETKVMAVGELPVDVLELSEIMFLSNEKGDGKDMVKKPSNPQNAFAPPLAPPGEEGKWTKQTDMPGARMCTSASTVKEKIYVIGGAKDEALSIVEEYNPATDKWTKKADMPTARLGLDTSVVKGKIYAIGGTVGSWTGISTVEEYDPATDTWTKKTDMPTPRLALSTGVVNGKIYAIGGGFSVDKIYGIVEEYDPATDTWTKKADMPTERAWLSTSVVNRNIYAIGGVLNPNVSVSTVEVYEPVTDIWTKKADMLTARCNLSTSIVNGYIYAIGGALNFPAPRFPLPAFSIVEAYDTGFRAVDSEGKLPTTWGRMKAE